MLIRRCAWHRRFHGYPLYFGVASWRGGKLSFTDGVCRGCAARVRSEWKLIERPIMISMRLRRVAATALSVALLAGTLLAPGPLSDLPARLQEVRVTAPSVEAPPVEAPTPKAPRVKPAPRKRVPLPARPRPDGLESAVALADAWLAAPDVEVPPSTEVQIAHAPIEVPPPSHIGTLEDELSRAIIERASTRLLLAMTVTEPRQDQPASEIVQAP